MTSTHHLKTLQPFFDAVVSGAKRFELRSNQDRFFQIGDTLVLQEYDLAFGKLTGRESRHLIGYVMSGPQYGIEAGYSVLSLVDRLPNNQDPTP